MVEIKLMKDVMFRFVLRSMIFSRSKQLQRHWEEMFLTRTRANLIVDACLLKLGKNLCHVLFSQWCISLERLLWHFSCIVTQDLISNVCGMQVFFLKKQQWSYLKSFKSRKPVRICYCFTLAMVIAEISRARSSALSARSRVGRWAEENLRFTVETGRTPCSWFELWGALGRSRSW